MTPEKTNFITQGYDGLRRLKNGPMLDSYRGLSVIHSRQYSLETGAPPRDLLRRRVRVAEYYRIPWQKSIGNGDNVMIDLYDESKDTFFTISWKDLLNHAALDEADLVKFKDMGNQPEVKNEPALAIAYENAKNEKDVISVLRMSKLQGNPDLQKTPGDMGEAYNEVKNDAHYGPAEISNDNKGGLILITNDISKRNSGEARYRLPIENAMRKLEVQSFYKGSGWFNGTANDKNVEEACIYYKTMMGGGGWGSIDLDGDLPDQNKRNQIFKKLMFGDSNDEYHINFGMRPNLHIGKMVYANLRPDTMRFKHVAAHIIAQTVVTRPLAIHLMKQVESKSKEKTELGKKILYMFGVDEVSKKIFSGQYNKFYNLETSVLAYMAAAVMHPDPEVRRDCRDKLKTNVNYDMEKIGESLVTWIKCFLNTIPIPRHGSESPAFDPYEQGRVLEKTFTVAGGGTTPEPSHIPVMYLGQYVSKTERTDAWTKAGNGNDSWKKLQNSKWKDNGTNDLAMDRDVGEHTFDVRRAFVFPDGKKAVEHQDIIAVLRTATAQDILIAFVTIMCKRFFTSRQELYVETSSPSAANHNNLVEFTTDNEEFKDGNVKVAQGITRRALTSNEYPTTFYGDKSMLEVNENWEIVIVRPNIEHNMLAAVLGRGGIDELGATFWGQTELSCYDDSMHGIWGMSYKYHERAMVTNEKNLIRLWDIAYDGYNGGKDDTIVSWIEESGHKSYRTLKSETANTTMPYTGPSIMVMAFPINNNDRIWERNWPSPIVFHESDPGKPLMQEPNYVLDPDNVERVFDERMRVFGQLYNKDSTDPVCHRRYERYYQKMPKFTYQHTTKKSAGQAVAENESTGNSLAFQGTFRVWKEPGENGGGGGTIIIDTKGSGHHGVDYVGAASVRSGKGYKITGESIQAIRQI